MKALRWFPLIVLILVSLACGLSNEGTKVGEVTQPSTNVTAPAINTSVPTTIASASPTKAPAQPTLAPTSAPTNPPAKPSTFKVGDIVAVQDHKITLNSVSHNAGILKANFLIENNGTKELTVSSIMSFNAKLDDGTKLDTSIYNCGRSVDAKVLPNDRLRGDICWKLPAAGALKLYYEASLLSSGAVVWQISPDDLKAKPTSQPSPLPTYPASIPGERKVGEVVSLSTQRVTMNSSTIANNILKVNFLVENTGTKDITVSSMLSFYARNSDGEKLDSQLSNCGTSMDGKVLPGDKLKGDICWKTEGAKNIKIYYDSEIITGNTVFWVIR